MKILLLDIETAPNRAFVWGMWDQNISADQMLESGYVLCWSAKWLGERAMHFASVGKDRANERNMLKQIHALLDEADVVIHYNGIKFDIPVLNREFIKFQMAPPSPYRQVDLLQVAKRAFRFESNKLGYVSTAIGIGAKVKHRGFELWVKCMEGDAQAWRDMERYNKRDVVLLEKLYKRLRPWIAKHPNLGAYGDAMCCPNCGSTRVQKRGEQVAQLLRYVRYQCQACATWFRGNKSVSERRASRGVPIVR